MLRARHFSFKNVLSVVEMIVGFEGAVKCFRLHDTASEIRKFSEMELNETNANSGKSWKERKFLNLFEAAFQSVFYKDTLSIRFIGFH